MNLRLCFIGFLLLFTIYSCSSVKSEKIGKSCNLEQIELRIGMNLDEVIDSIACPLGNISDCKGQYPDKNWKLLVIFIDKKGRLDTFFDKDLNLVYYKYLYD